MSIESTTPPNAATAWQVKQVYAMAVICLVIGLAIGYLFRGTQSPAAAALPEAPDGNNGNSNIPANARSSATSATMAGGKMPTLEEMKQMADKKAAPLLEKLKSDPNNKDLLIQVGTLYRSTHQFKEATDYYGKALQVDPRDVPLRTLLASCLYYNGDVDGAIGQLQQSLRYQPKDPNALFNLGMIKWQGKQDGKGALAAWQLLLKSNPQLDRDRKATVQKLMADVQMQGKS
jgi:cytochrome c-type biogenesis protein CcmH/NrfG